MILDCKVIRDKKLLEYKEYLEYRGLTLAIVSVGDDYGSSVYIRNKESVCKECGVTTKHIKVMDKHDGKLFSNIVHTISGLNRDDSIDGIILQLPIVGLSKDEIGECLDTIDYNKDIDGLTDYNKLYKSIDGLLPCTVRSVIDILQYYKKEIRGKNVVILGRSDIVGKPLRDILDDLDGTVTVLHSKSKDKGHYLKNADIVVSAVGKAKLFSSKDLASNKDVTVIDVGITRDKDNKICGDFDSSNVGSNIDYTTVPGGVGLLTTVNVVGNLIILHERAQEDMLLNELITAGVTPSQANLEAYKMAISGVGETTDVSLDDDNYFNTLLASVDPKMLH